MDWIWIEILLQCQVWLSRTNLVEVFIVHINREVIVNFYDYCYCDALQHCSSSSYWHWFLIAAQYYKLQYQQQSHKRRRESEETSITWYPFTEQKICCSIETQRSVLKFMSIMITLFSFLYNLYFLFLSFVQVTYVECLLEVRGCVYIWMWL